MVILREGMCPGLTADVVLALKVLNVKTVVDLVSADTEEIARKCCLPYKTLVAVRRVLLAQYSAFPSSGSDLYTELMGSTAILSTGNSSLDKLLDLGLYTGEVTELTGSPSSGKTQICLGLAAKVSHDLKQNVLYIDSTGGFAASRLLQMVQSKTDNMEEQTEALQRVKVVRVFSIFEMMDILQGLRNSFSQQFAGVSSTMKAVIVDSVAAVISSILGSKQAEGLSLMMQLARELKMLAKEQSVAVVVTNPVTTDGRGSMKAALGRSWSSVPSTRVLLRYRDRGEVTPSTRRIAMLMKSARQPTNISVEFDIGSYGFPPNGDSGLRAEGT
ncbi:DNA repair protein RAD51 homolog 4 [Latimeria chalumnae]|uniref:DNA repair protein RAD51 homolog 4 n=1 Tax=Latimeria chalumnae TaxID=7897 RepID=UPI00313E956F